MTVFKGTPLDAQAARIVYHELLDSYRATRNWQRAIKDRVDAGYLTQTLKRKLFYINLLVNSERFSLPDDIAEDNQ